MADSITATHTRTLEAVEFSGKAWINGKEIPVEVGPVAPKLFMTADASLSEAIGAPAEFQEETAEPVKAEQEDERAKALELLKTQAYCVKCRAKRVMANPERITMKNGKPATQGNCPLPDCGTKMFKIGG